MITKKEYIIIIIIFISYGCNTKKEPAMKNNIKDKKYSTELIDKNDNINNNRNINNSLDLAEIENIIKSYDTNISKLEIEMSNMLLLEEKDVIEYVENILNSDIDEKDIYDIGKKAAAYNNYILKYYIVSGLYENTLSEDMRKKCLSDLIFTTESLDRNNETIKWCTHVFENYKQVKWLNTIAYTEIAASYYKLGYYDKAKTCYEELYEIKKNPFTYMNISACYYKQKNYDKALESIDIGLKNISDEGAKSHMNSFRNLIESSINNKDKEQK